MSIQPYEDVDEYTDDRLLLAELRIALVAERDQLAAAERRRDHAGVASFADAVAGTTLRLAATRSTIESRVAATRADAELSPLKLRHCLRLSDTEEAIVWLLAAVELSPEARAARGALEPDTTSGLTLGSLRRIVYGDRDRSRAWRELSSAGALAQLAVVDTDGAHGWSFTASRVVRIAPTILALLHGSSEIDRALDEVARIVEPSRHPIVIDEFARQRLAEAVASPRPVVVVTGPSHTGRTSALVSAAAVAGHTVLELDMTRMPRDRETLGLALRRAVRDCRLLGAIPLLSRIDALGPREGDPDLLEVVERHLASRLDGPILATAAARVALRWERPCTCIELPPLTERQRVEVWRISVPAATSGDAEVMARRYPLAPGLIMRAGAVLEERTTGRLPTPDDVHDAIASVVENGMGALATKVLVTQGWDDLVLPIDQLEAVSELIGRVRQRGRVFEAWGFGRKIGRGLGIAALISGPPGTGKTMVAGLIARELGIDLYRVDLANVVSKWVGETEKQLGLLFEAAEAGNAILLFDEADALFTKRTDVTSSNDRYANLEVNYLLQRLESFSGVCILTTNHETVIDPAFLRRLSQHIRFDDPEHDERVELWNRLLPVEVPVDGPIDAQELARRFSLTGGYIRNAVLRAAFAAAEADRSLTMLDLIWAAKRECEGMGRLPPPDVGIESAA